MAQWCARPSIPLTLFCYALLYCCKMHHYSDCLFLHILPFINTFLLFNMFPYMFCSVLVCRHRCSACRSPWSIHRSRRNRHRPQSNGQSVGHFFYHHIIYQEVCIQSIALYFSLLFCVHDFSSINVIITSSPLLLSSLLFLIIEFVELHHTWPWRLRWQILWHELMTKKTDITLKTINKESWKISRFISCVLYVWKWHECVSSLILNVILIVLCNKSFHLYANSIAPTVYFSK